MGPHCGGIASLGATLEEYWDALEADFQSVYGLDLREELHRTGCRRLLALIEQLPAGSAFGRAQGGRDPMELMHEWMLTLIQFQAGEKVTTPSLVRESSNGSVDAIPDVQPAEPLRVDTSDPDGIEAFFDELG